MQEIERKIGILQINNNLNVRKKQRARVIIVSTILEYGEIKLNRR